MSRTVPLTSVPWLEQDYLLVNGEKTAMCGSLNSPRTFIFPAKRRQVIFLYTDSTFLNKVRR